jgi:hypothetical protein
MTEIYGLLDPGTGELRYIGKANNSRKRLASHLRDSRRRDTPVYRWIRKLLSKGLAPELVVLAECDDWKAKEIELIAKARGFGFRLLNVADGGDEPHCPMEVRRKNGRKSAAKRNDVVFYLIQRFGRNAKWCQQRGDTARAELQLMAQRRLRTMNNEERERFANEWIARGRWYPGKENGKAHGVQA